MPDVTEQLRRYGDAVAETVEPVSAADVPATMAWSERPRSGRWRPLAAAAAVIVVLAGAVGLAARSWDSSPSDQVLASGGDEVEVGVATVVIPDGMTLEQLGPVDPPVDTPKATRSDGSTLGSDATPPPVRALLHTAAGTCTVTSYEGSPHPVVDAGVVADLRRQNNVAVQRYNAALTGYAQLRYELEERVAALDQQLAALPPGSDAASIASQRDAARQQVDRVNQQAFALAQRGPERPPGTTGFVPTDASRTTWSARATLDDVVRVACTDRATARQLVDATTLPATSP